MSTQPTLPTLRAIRSTDKLHLIEMDGGPGIAQIWVHEPMKKNADAIYHPRDDAWALTLAMAAAPELLAACRRMVIDLQEIIVLGDISLAQRQHLHAIRKRMLSAIAKAEGKAQT